MPCRDFRDDDRVIIQENTKKIDKLTRFLCGVMTQLQDRGISINMSENDLKGLREWWEQHQEQDRKRLAAEEAARKRKELRKSGLSKLTKAEKSALGIRGGA